MGYNQTMGTDTEQPTAQAHPIVKDPVCGMDVACAASQYRTEHDGQTYYFCSGHCHATFEASPQTYLNPHAGPGHDHAHHHQGHPGAADSAAAGVEEWTCPMHPEIRRPGPGPCP